MGQNEIPFDFPDPYAAKGMKRVGMETLKSELLIPIKNMPKSGSFYLLDMTTHTEKTRLFFLFGSCGGYAQISPCLPKYGKFTCQYWASKAP
jgi:hypothetical protein